MKKCSLDFDENWAFVFAFLIAISILLKISATLFLKVLQPVEDAINGAELYRRCLLFSFSDRSIYSGLLRSDIYLRANITRCQTLLSTISNKPSEMTSFSLT